MNMVVGTFQSPDDSKCQYRPQRSPQCKAIYMNPSPSGIHGTTASMRSSPQKSLQEQQQQQQQQQRRTARVSPPRSEIGSSYSSSPERHDTGPDVGKSYNSSYPNIIGLSINGNIQLHHNVSEGNLSSCYQNGRDDSFNLPNVLPIFCSSEDVSKKRRRRCFNCTNWNYAYIQQRVIFWFIVIYSIWHMGRFVQRVYRGYLGENLPPPQTLDFLVAGFPKSGTTTLLATLRDHPQIAMDSEEYCQIARPIQQDDVNLKRLNRYLFALKNSVVEKRNNEMSYLPSVFSSDAQQPHPLEPHNLLSGIKCPDAVKNFKAIHRLSQHSPDCKFIIGLRHPISFLQSFYNYRVLEAHQLKDNPEIPSLFEIWEQNLNWRDISPDSTRYELYLSQFGKTGMSLNELQNWLIERPMLAIKPNRFRLFLYTLEQVEDNSQGALFRRDLQRFLGLSEEIKPFGHENKIPSSVDQYKETINICSAEYSSIRSHVLQHAVVTVQWMHKFLDSLDVIVSDKRFLMKQVETWTKDPCEDASVAAV